MQQFFQEVAIVFYLLDMGFSLHRDTQQAGPGHCCCQLGLHGGHWVPAAFWLCTPKRMSQPGSRLNSTPFAPVGMVADVDMRVRPAQQLQDILLTSIRTVAIQAGRMLATATHTRRPWVVAHLEAITSLPTSS